MADAPRVVPVSHRFSREITRWTRGINSEKVFHPSTLGIVVW